MTEYSTGAVMSAPITKGVGTSAAGEQVLASSLVEENRSRWNEVLDCRLIEWMIDPTQLADEDVDPPSPAALDTAVKIAVLVRDRGGRAPLRVVPNGNGGVVFEGEGEDCFETIDVDEDGSAEWRMFQGCKVVSRCPLL